MTYNFDPDDWYATRHALLQARSSDGELDEKEFAEAVAELDRRYEEMVDRLDGSYCLPDSSRPAES